MLFSDFDSELFDPSAMADVLVPQSYTTTFRFGLSPSKEILLSRGQMLGKVFELCCHFASLSKSTTCCIPGREGIKEVLKKVLKKVGRFAQPLAPASPGEVYASLTEHAQMKVKDHIAIVEQLDSATTALVEI